ncbi:MAG: hypothetical protein H7239_03310 [Flavobacterium sp.]|nr:hypothetical protein [Flavobacterium sp.]
MKKYYIASTLLFFITLIILSCSKSDSPADYIPVSPVSVNLATVPYPKLSDYHFFDGDLKNLNPSLGVLPYEPASSLFSDYAHKKRFVWMPNGTKANFDGDANVLNLPVGAALVKTFYYDNVLPSNTTRIVETRIMIRKTSGWIFAEYVWNNDQTEAYFDLNGSYTDIQWKDENNVIKNVNYRIPNEVQCIVCHKAKQIVNGVEVINNIPIGIKPQNLNTNYTYEAESKNQLTKWIDYGYLQNNFSLPSTQNSTVNYKDTSKDLEVRARSYIDINCAHCHQLDRHCDYRPMRFAFSETANNHANMGVCVPTSDMQDFPSQLSSVVTPQNIDQSMLFYRINTTNESYRMPLHGRTLIHTEGVLLIKDWINSLHDCN